MSFWFRFGRIALTTALPNERFRLSGPIRRQLVGRDAPHLLRVALEEHAVQAPAEAGRGPALEGRLVRRLLDADPDVRAPAEERLPDPDDLEHVHRAAAGSRRTCSCNRCGSCGGEAGSPRPGGSRATPSRPRHLGEEAVPPMSKRQPSRSTVRLMPPTTESASSTVATCPRLVNSHAAVSPAGPAPMMTTCSTCSVSVSVSVPVSVSAIAVGALLQSGVVLERWVGAAMIGPQ